MGFSISVSMCDNMKQSDTYSVDVLVSLFKH